MTSYFSRRPPKGMKRKEPMGFLDFSTAHDPVEYRKQRHELDGGRLDRGYDDSKPQKVKEVDNGNK